MVNKKLNNNNNSSTSNNSKTSNSNTNKNKNEIENSEVMAFYRNLYSNLSVLKKDGGIPETISFIKPIEKLIECIGDYIRASQSTGVTSIGCGYVLLELLLTQKIDNVVGVDFNGTKIIGGLNKRGLPKKSINFIGIKDENEIVQVPKENALLFCLGKIKTAQEYINNYQGNCIIIIGDSDSIPNFTNLDRKKWVLKCEKDCSINHPTGLECYIKIYFKYEYVFMEGEIDDGREDYDNQTE